MTFRDHVADLDTAVFEALSDEVEIDGKPDPVMGMFYSPWLDVETVRGQRTGLREPFVILRDADAAGVRQRTRVQALGDVFSVMELQPDGSGMTKLVLRPEPCPSR
ncbi:MAG: head-tail joining protein [Ralstonia sp.]|uniref:head-tail joining protein n=1 Tax=Ralstonia sp. TaxID=54061 RepID=UPI003F7E317E